MLPAPMLEVRAMVLFSTRRLPSGPFHIAPPSCPVMLSAMILLMMFNVALLPIAAPSPIESLTTLF